ncbi:MAG: Hpt domain-containing protein [Anaerolineaceae bacterium]|nr:Hpt domain-containing protein [Anaerolineaceae bacterium]
MTIQELEIFGANTKEGLTRCLNNESFYLSLVRKFAQEDKIEQLRAAAEARDFDKAFGIAHNLKGSTGNLALTPLYKPIAEMSDLLKVRTDMDYSPYIEEITRQFQSLKEFFQI